MTCAGATHAMDPLGRPLDDGRHRSEARAQESVNWELKPPRRACGRRRRLRRIVGAAALVLALSSTVATAQAPSGDSVTGQARGCNPCFVNPDEFIVEGFIEINATSGSDGERPSGTASMQTFFGTPTGTRTSTLQVTCLDVAGGTAVVGVTGRAVFGTGSRSLVVGFLRVIDAGGPDSGLDTFEESLTFSDFTVIDPSPRPPPPGPTDCSTFPAAEHLFHNDHGDLSVTDTKPLPNSKDQCKNGGWRNYSDTFKNQGQCVAFVQRGPKP